MKDEDKTKVELIKELKKTQKEREKGVFKNITERKEAEEELKESEERYHAVFENTGTATMVVEEDMTISMVNTQCKKMCGYSKKKIENKMKWTDFIVPEDLERIKKYHIARRKTGEKAPTEYEFRLIDRKGNIKDIFLKIGIIPNTKKSIASLMDITEWKQAEEEIKSAAVEWQTTFDAMNDAICLIDNNGILLQCNQSYINLFGKTKTEILGKHCWEVVHGTNKSIDGCPFVKLKKSLQRESMLLLIDDKWFNVVVDPIFDANNNLIKAVHIMTDITEWKKATEEIEKFSKFPAENPNPVLRISKDGTVLFHNHPSETLLKHWHYKEGKPLQDRWFQSVLDALRDDDIKTTETEIGDKVISLTFAPIVEKDFVNVYGLDITNRKLTEKQIKESEERLKILFDYAPDAYYISDLKGNFVDGNKAAERVIGFKREELIRGNFLKSKLLSLADIAKAAKLLVKNLRGQPTGPDEFVLNRKDNSKITIEISTYPVKIKGKTLVLGIARDITERKQAEERLKKSLEASINTMSKIVEIKDPYTAGHQQRVSQLTTAIAKELNLSQDKIEGIRVASLIHDIGKISVPTEILSKSITLTDIEFALIKEHSKIGYDILKSIDFSYPVANIVLQHHEKVNGSGYPGGLKRDEILLEAKIICVADVVEAMSSHRPYRPALGFDAALEEISQNRGILYDPEVVDVCIKLFKEKKFKFKP